jgi:hypothetical protein
MPTTTKAGNAMTIRQILTAAVVSAGLLAGIAATAIPAAASTAPVAIYANNGGWVSGHSVEPRTIYLGADYGIYSMHWSHWSTSATGTGTLKAGSEIATVTVYLSHIKSHGSVRYFATMHYTGRYSQWLVMSTSFGWWVQI